jgi:hypothetical protein
MPVRAILFKLSPPLLTQDASFNQICSLDWDLVASQVDTALLFLRSTRENLEASVDPTPNQNINSSY